MLKRRAMALLCGAALMAALAGCGGGTAPAATPVPAPALVQQAGPLQSLRIVNLGSELYPVRSVTDFAPGKLSYSSAAAPSAPAVNFTAVLADEDFQRLAALVESARLTTTLGQSSGYDTPCRHMGYEIGITRSDASFQFTIPGTQVCGLAARAGLLDLLRLQDELVAKYTPKAGG